MKLNNESIIQFRLYRHHLHKRSSNLSIPQIAGICGMQNTPPGAWEVAVFNRIATSNIQMIEDCLYSTKDLIQAWSFRGNPVIFPVEESATFLSALRPQGEEEWIYTHGIGLALDFLQMDFDDLLDKIKTVLPRLDDEVIQSKSELDQTVAKWIEPLLSLEKQSLWKSPSMYGMPHKQTVGGAVVSFLLRPCSFLGLVVFGTREGTSPTFTSYKRWMGHPLIDNENAGQNLVRKYLHCYAPATVADFATWLGCSGKQAKRMWQQISEEMAPVILPNGKTAFVLSDDRTLLNSPLFIENELLLLGGHDPYLDQPNRDIILDDKALQKKVWQMVSNPGTILFNGKIIGTWIVRKKVKGIDMTFDLWETCLADKKALVQLAEEYAAFRQTPLLNIVFPPGE